MNIQIHPTATCAEEAIFKGSYPVAIGKSTIIHPFSTFDATMGPITIGEYSIICERSVIQADSPGLVIGNHCLVDIGVRVIKAAEIRDGVVLDVGCLINQECVIGANSRINAKVEVSSSINADTIVMHGGSRRIVVSRRDTQRQQCEALALILSASNAIRIG